MGLVLIMPDTCRICGSDVIWTPLAATGALVPVDPDPDPEPAAQLVALNPKTRLCRRLNHADLPMAQTWAAHGVTFHTEHNCRNAA